MFPSRDSPNQWADFWRNECGLNVFPADTKNKKTYEEWGKWQDTPISDEQHEEWKNNNSFSKGMAIIAGKIWHRPDLEDSHLCFIDVDNEMAIEEVCTIFGAKNIHELSQVTVVEQHLDNKTKAHVYFYTQHVLKKKSSDATRNLKNKLDSNEIPAIEVKCQSDGIAYCTPSPHKDGFNYEIIGTTKIGTFNGKEIEDLLYEVYKKYGLIVDDQSNGQSNFSKIPIEELFKPGFKIMEGHNRSEGVMRVAESLYARYRSTKSLETLKQETYKWMVECCDPPLDQDKFERQFKDGIRFVDKTFIQNQGSVLLQQLKIKNEENALYKIVDFKIPYRAFYVDEKLGQICLGLLKDDGIFPLKSIINIIPKKLIVYKNPLLPMAEPKVELEYYEKNQKNYVSKIGPLNSTFDILKELQRKNYVLNKTKSEDAFNSIISAMKEHDGLVEYKTDVTTSGYYYIDGKMVKKNTSIDNIEIRKEDVIQCCNFLNKVSSMWKDRSIFPTVLKWAIMSPFSFMIKSNQEEIKWMPWLQLYGQGQSGKTTLGLISLYIWNKKPSTHNKGFNNIDTTARLGEVVSKDTHPILINEVGSLSETGKFRRYTGILELIKHAVESHVVRGKLVDYNRYEEILALSPLILTSNYSPPNDGSLSRRFTSIHFSKDEKKESDEQLSFGKIMEENRKYLPVLGKFTEQYIDKDPSVLFRRDWKDIAKKTLIDFYQFADLEKPEWIDYFIEQKDAIDESNEKTMFALRAFLVDRINSAFSRNSRNDNNFNGLKEKLEYCLDYNLVPFLHRITSKGRVKENTIIITHDILDEMNKSWTKIENITTLKDIGLQLGLEHGGKYLNDKKTKVVFGPQSKLVKFINPEILSEEDNAQ